MYLQQTITIGSPDKISFRKAEHIGEMFKKKSEKIGEKEKQWMSKHYKLMHRTY